jgi:biopolymer transport protein ExbB/TolQ
MNTLETLLYEVSKLFLTPVLIALGLMFIYAFFALGTLMFDLALRQWRGSARQPLRLYLRRNPSATQDALELQLLKLLEPLKIVSRVAPMLGLVATMIPMGPALVAVSSGNTQGIAQNLVVAFAAVIVALLAAAITYVVLSIRRRWLLLELHAVLGSSPNLEASRG